MDKLLIVAVLLGALGFLILGFMQAPAELSAAQAIVKSAQDDVASALESYATCKNKGELALSDMRLASKFIVSASSQLNSAPANDSKLSFGGEYREATRQASLASEYARRVHNICDK